MSWDAVLPIIGAVGGLAGLSQLINVIANRPRNVRQKGEAEVAHIQSQIVVGSLEAAAKTVVTVTGERDAANAKNGLLIDLVQALIRAYREIGGDPERYQDQLDDIRTM